MNSKPRKQDELNLLISSMSKNEKRHFKLYTAMYGAGKEYNALFDELAKSDTYDAAALSQKLRKKPTQLANEKTYLQNSVLRAIRSYEGDKDIDNRLYDALSYIRILHHRGRYNMALAIASAAQKEAEHYERWEVLLMLLKTEINILYASDVPLPEQSERQADNVRRMKYATGQISLLNQFSDICIRVEAIQAKGKLARDKKDVNNMKNMLQEPVMIKKYTHVLPQRIQADLVANMASYLGEQATAARQMKKILDLIDRYPKHINYSPIEYFIISKTYVIHLILAYDYHTAYRYIASLKTKSFAHLNYNEKTVSTLVTQHTISQELFLARVLKDRKRAIEALDRLKNNYEIFMMLPSIPDRASGLGNAAKICFYQNMPEQCIYWIEKLFKDIHPLSSVMIHNVCRIMFVMCHAELKNYTLLPYLVRNTERHLKKNNGYMATEKITLDFLKKLPLYHTEQERKQAYGRLFNEYMKIKGDKSTPNSFGYLQYPMWAARNAGIEYSL